MTKAPFRRYIGDVHHNFDRYLAIRSAAPVSTQVGDFGAGFEPLPEHDPAHQFERGNHDHLETCKTHPGWIPDGAFINGAFHVGGGKSSDKQHRFVGNSWRSDGLNDKNWWPDEELSIPELNAVIDRYADLKPEIVVSHEGPADITQKIFYELAYDPRRQKGRAHDPGRTAIALQAMFEIHKPNLWIFGHWHRDIDMKITDCRFICLDELSYIDIVEGDFESGTIVSGRI